MPFAACVSDEKKEGKESVKFVDGLPWMAEKG
jgi:hypothetical protein